MIIKRGFEYIIQDLEPEEEAEGTEILEEDEEGFEIGEYNLNSQELYDLENGKKDWEATTIWWFRAICYDEIDTKYTAGSWMKNVPTVETDECTDTNHNSTKGNGDITDKGANEITNRGFRVIKEYKGNQWNMNFYIGVTVFFDAKFNIMEEVEKHTILGGDDGYTIMGYYWTGKFYRDTYDESEEIGIYNKVIGGGFDGEGFGIYLKPKDTYKIQAIAENDLGWGFGDEVEVTTSQIVLSIDDEQIADNKFEKTVTLGTIPLGMTVTRIGIRLGRTKSCSELHYFEDGSFGTGESVTFMVELEPNSKYYIMPYIVVDYGGYEEEILGMMNYTDPDMEEEYLANYPVEVTEDIEEDEEEELTTSAGEGNYSYRLLEKEILCEKIGEQSLIDYYGRRRGYTVNNHLIQTKNLCCVIISDYLDKFQRIKLKVAVDIDMPIPFEGEDVILLGDGKILYKNTGQGLIAFKTDGEGEISQRGYILAKVRKIDANYIAETEKVEAILSLELEV